MQKGWLVQKSPKIEAEIRNFREKTAIISAKYDNFAEKSARFTSSFSKSLRGMLKYAICLGQFSQKIEFCFGGQISIFVFHWRDVNVELTLIYSYKRIIDQNDEEDQSLDNFFQLNSNFFSLRCVNQHSNKPSSTLFRCVTLRQVF